MFLRVVGLRPERLVPPYGEAASRPNDFAFREGGFEGGDAGGGAVRAGQVDTLQRLHPVQKSVVGVFVHNKRREPSQTAEESGRLRRNMGRQDGWACRSANDRPIANRVTFMGVTPDGGNVVIKLGGELFTDRPNLGHDGIRLHR